MKKLLSLILVVLLAGLFSCESTNDVQKMERKSLDLTKVEKDVLGGSTQFGLDLFKAVSKQEIYKNRMISPLSVSLAFGMVINGAENNTLKQIKEYMGYSGLSNDEVNQANLSLISKMANVNKSVVFDIANSVWYRQGFSIKEKFLNDNKYFYNAEISKLDFSNPSSVNTINNWVSGKTNGKIPTIIDDIDPRSVLFLINALYFKGDWMYIFDETKTKTVPFYNEDKTNAVTDVKMMHLKTNFNNYVDENLVCVDIPYGDSLFSMKVIMPADGQSFNNMLYMLDKNYLSKINKEMKLGEIEVGLPRFRVSDNMELQDVLASMGITDAFTDKADFSKITDDFIYISKVIHKTYIDVNEKGTEAAAVTAVDFRTTSIGQNFIFNKPFIFIISAYGYDNVMFIGSIVNPNLGY